LVDTVEDIAIALNKTLAELNVPSHPDESVRTMVGGGLAKLLDRALVAHGVALEQQGRTRAAERLLQHYAAEPAARSRLYPGAAEALRILQEEGVARGLCTNKPDPIARDLL
jgi:phosphoglycolate phosphatase